MDNLIFNVLIEQLNKIVPQLQGNIPAQFSLICIIVFSFYICIIVLDFVSKIIFGLISHILTYLSIKKRMSKKITYLQFNKAVYKVKKRHDLDEVYYELSCILQEKDTI